MSRRAEELTRYAVNGIFATAIHFLVLTVNLEVFRLESAGLANLIAAAAGIATSYAGNRYFVFARTGEKVSTQASKFFGLYAAIAVLHGSILFIWADVFGLDYRIGFVLCTAIQVVIGFLANKLVVFRA